jgi:hypothetical protein
MKKYYNSLTELGPSDIGLKDPLELPYSEKERLPSLALADVVGLSSVIHAVIVTLDAELAMSEGSEAHLLERLTEAIRSQLRRHHAILPETGLVKRHKAIRSAIRAARLPEPSDVSGIETLLRDHGVI